MNRYDTESIRRVLLLLKSNNNSFNNTTNTNLMSNNNYYYDDNNEKKYKKYKKWTVIHTNVARETDRNKSLRFLGYFCSYHFLPTGPIDALEVTTSPTFCKRYHSNSVINKDPRISPRFTFNIFDHIYKMKNS